MEFNNCASCSSCCRCNPTNTPKEEMTAPMIGGLPLSLASDNDTGTVVRISGDKDTKRYLTDLGFALGSKVSIVKKASGNIIVDVKGSRIAMGPSIASRIHIVPE